MDAKYVYKKETLSDDNIDNNNNNPQKCSFLEIFFFNFSYSSSSMYVCVRTEQYYYSFYW